MISVSENFAMIGPLTGKQRTEALCLPRKYGNTRAGSLGAYSTCEEIDVLGMAESRRLVLTCALDRRLRLDARRN